MSENTAHLRISGDGGVSTISSGFVQNSLSRSIPETLKGGFQLPRGRQG